MINDGDKFKIIHNGYGSFSVSDCTLDNAVALLNRYVSNLGSHVKEAVDIIQGKKHYVVSNQLVIRALEEIFEAKPGDELPKTTRLIHGKPVEGMEVATLTLDATYLTQLMTWAQLNGVAWTELKTLVSRASYGLNDMHPDQLFLLKGIYSRAGERIPAFFDADTIELADEVAVLQKNQWKDTAKVSSVVQRYLTFITEQLTHRDEKFELGNYSASDE